MTSITTPTILMVPGLRDHVAEHWQTLLESKLPNAVSVPPLEHDKLSCAARVAALEHLTSVLCVPRFVRADQRKGESGEIYEQHQDRKYRPDDGGIAAADCGLEYCHLPAIG